jgi:hypothetical protein
MKSVSILISLFFLLSSSAIHKYNLMIKRALKYT